MIKKIIKKDEVNIIKEFGTILDSLRLTNKMIKNIMIHFY